MNNTYSLYKKMARVLVLVMLNTSPLFAEEENLGDVKPAPPKEGNFLLPGTQRQGPLISFGQNVLNQGQAQLWLFADDFGGANLGVGDLQPYGIYGLTDASTILIDLPVKLNSGTSTNPNTGESVGRSASFGDAVLQFESAVFARETASFEDQVTLVGNIIFPTSSGKNNPPVSEGNYSFLLGGTASRMYPNWYIFTSEAFIPVTSHHGTKPGDRFLYQGGLGRVLFTLDADWLFAFLLELDGQYLQSNRVNGRIDPNSGGNTMIFTPSFWISSQRFVLQLGMGVFPVQNLRGNQAKEEYLLVGNIGWTFW